MYIIYAPVPLDRMRIGRTFARRLFTATRYKVAILVQDTHPGAPYDRPMRTLLALSFFSLALLAQPQPPPDMKITPERRAKIIEGVAQRIETMYVDPEKGRAIAADLRATERAGTFASITSALDLTGAVGKVLRKSGDAHLRFGYQHEPSTATNDEPETPEQHAADIREAAENGFGIQGVERLPGNVGLLSWKKFHEPSIAGEAVMAAMKQLASSDALIIDLRNSDGGSPDMVILLLTCFMPEGDPLLVSTIYRRPDNSTRQYWTLSYLDAPRYVGKKVYILTSKRTWSAGEGFTEHMRRLRQAVIVGETTRGGAHMARWELVDPNFAVSVPVARHLPQPGLKDWEGVGVAPDVAVAEADALHTAHLMALHAIREATTDASRRTSLDETIAEIEKKK